MEDPTRKPKLKLNIRRDSQISSASTPRGIGSGTIVATPGIITPGGTPSTPSGAHPRKIILKSQPSTPAAETPQPRTSSTFMPPPPTIPAIPTLTRTKAGRMSRPTARKRAGDEMDNDDQPPPTSRPARPSAKRVKIKNEKGDKKASATAKGSIVIKREKAPVRPPFSGYDSEAEDLELDPVIEEEFVLRMMPGEDCEYIRRMIEEKKIGVPFKDGGADISMKFFDEHGRRALVRVNGRLYAAALLDLPTITEATKTWDRKALVKTADICQMLLCFAKVTSEAEAKTAPLPRTAIRGRRWPHGLTPPMHDCIHRRFRKRLSKDDLEDKEAEVNRLLNADREALNSTFEFVSDEVPRPDDEEGEEDEDSEEEEEEQDAEGEVDDGGYFGPQHGYDPGNMDIDEASLEADLEAEYEMDTGMPEPTETPATQAGTQVEGITPMPHSADEGDAENDDEEEEDEEEDEDLDEDAQARRDEMEGILEDIKELEKQLASLQQQKETTANAILKKRIMDNMRKVESEIELKRAAINQQG